MAKPTYFGAAALFMRILGLCYLAAFVSLWVQVDGLVGSRGILPAGPFLDWVRGQTGAERYALLPTLCWISSSDAFLHALCAAGAASALLLVAGLVPALAAGAAWLLYLSLAIAGQVFLEFQWDYLLLETGFLAILLVSFRRAHFGAGLSASPTALFLLRWLLFRLMFSSGWVKLASGDPSWRGLTALRYHYETQPLPPWTAWFMHQLPAGFQTASALFLFFVELVVPLLYFAPRRLRVFAFAMTLLLQALIAATGNYAFFNLLTVALAVLLLDDQSLPGRWAARAAAAAVPARPWPRAILAPVAGLVLFASSVAFVATLDRAFPFPRAVVSAYGRLAAFRSANTYGLFMVMTTERPEILVEGSDDGIEWRAYEFRWKPGDPGRRPAFVAPHQPRLDWQMWFAALGRTSRIRGSSSFSGACSKARPRCSVFSRATPFRTGRHGTCARSSTTTASRISPSAAARARGGAAARSVPTARSWSAVASRPLFNMMGGPDEPHVDDRTVRSHTAPGVAPRGYRARRAPPGIARPAEPASRVRGRERPRRAARRRGER